MQKLTEEETLLILHRFYNEEITVADLAMQMGLNKELVKEVIVSHNSLGYESTRKN